MNPDEAAHEKFIEVAKGTYLLHNQSFQSWQIAYEVLSEQEVLTPYFEMRERANKRQEKYTTATVKKD